jgi:murein DD-endopeptidase MepM/ murein hydrolase activator NlpD
MKTRRTRVQARTALLPLAVLSALLLVSCARPSPLPPTATVLTTQVPEKTAAASSTPQPTEELAAPVPETVLSPSPTASPTLPPAPQVCSPLEGIAIADLGLPDLLKNPFQMPRPGMDDGHHGADFAYWSRGERTTMQGLPILAALDGRVAGVIYNRIPYGNALIIETPLDSMPLGWAASAPTPQPTIPAPGNLNCPADRSPYTINGPRSAYLLYAHMDETPLVKIGETVRCGQAIGAVGTTGKSVNPHLHLEVRVGPSGATFESMAHYDAAASEQEMAAYCTWRTSGLFEMVDPMALFE